MKRLALLVAAFSAWVNLALTPAPVLAAASGMICAMQTQVRGLAGPILVFTIVTIAIFYIASEEHIGGIVPKLAKVGVGAALVLVVDLIVAAAGFTGC